MKLFLDECCYPFRMSGVTTAIGKGYEFPVLNSESQPFKEKR